MFELDLLVADAAITTLDDDGTTARFLGVRNGRIVGIWDGDPQVAARRRLDAGGAIVLPGFHDAHCHTVAYGLSLAEIDLIDVADGRTLLERIAAAAETGDGWIIGCNLRPYVLGGDLPTLSELDRASNGRPTVLRFTSRHGMLVNTTVMQQAGILDSGFVVPAGGRVEQDAEGRPNGLLHESAQNAVLRLTQDRSADDIVAAIRRATSVYAAEGIVGFTDAGVGAGLIGHGTAEIGAYLRAEVEQALRARAQIMPTIDTLMACVEPGTDEPRAFSLLATAASGFGGDWVSFGQSKFFFDGALTTETAAMTTDYPGGHQRGLLAEDPDVLLRRARIAYRDGWALAIHAIGDRAVDVALDVIGECQAEFGRLAVPNRIEHAGIVRDDQLVRLAELGVVVTPQTAFFHQVGDYMHDHLDPSQHAQLYRGRTFLDAGVALAGSSDRPCVDGTALRSIDSFTDRLSESGQRIGGGDESLTRIEALRAYTAMSTAAGGLQQDRGTIEVGKLADLTVLDGSLPLNAPEPLAYRTVLGTIVGGEFTHRVPGFGDSSSQHC